ncbi:MAG: hypothetical protein KY475_02110 [Planctomycetes bacterium]|nr:hypothetical protein [Planctomycetota bacterium]
MEKLQDAPSAAKKTEIEQLLEQASSPFVGRWNKLVTMTNWEKGRIIHDWREALAASGAPVTEYSDEAWARRVAGVTGQHVGRLRRVYQKFGEVYPRYEGLYWSHFQAALDWDDSEQWLKQAQSRSWSVAQMRNSRWESLGVPPEKRVAEEEVVDAELDEDFEPALKEKPGAGGLTPTLEQARSAGDEEGPRIEGPDFGDEDDDNYDPAAQGFGDERDEASPAAPLRPFANIGELPEDVVEAFEAYKLAILRHKRENWRQITLEEMIATLDSLKELALAPAAEPAPF